MIITFYSYKGGCGRTMALANLAVLLAAENNRVLAVDFDLEAPGLWRYFSDFDPNVFEHNGLLDLICAQSDHSEQLHWQDYVQEIYFSGGSLSLLTSGKFDEGYPARVLGLDWDTFFSTADGGEFFERLRNDWCSAYDYVLIDSRTGVTDAGGICTIQLPDMIVPVCVPNYQSIEGVTNIIESAQIARRNFAYDRPPALVMPLLSRFDSRTEYESAREWLDIAAERLARFYDDWLPKEITPRQALEWTKLPYVAYFSFGERLPVLGSDLSDPDSLGYAFKRLTNLIRSDLAEIQNLVSSEQRPEPVSPIESARWDFFISYVESDQSWAEWIAWSLEEAGYRVLLASDIAPGSKWAQSLRNGISRAARTIIVLSQEYVQSVYGTAEWQAAWSFDPDGAKGKLIPVRVADCDRPGPLAALVGIDLFARSEGQAKAELLKSIGIVRHGRGKPLFEPGGPGGGQGVDQPPRFPGTISTNRQVLPSNSNLPSSDDELSKSLGRERFDYDAFISRGRHDEAVAAGIEKGLHRIGRRVGQRHALRVWRFTTYLGTSPDLWGQITEAMDRSRYLIVVLSRRAAASLGMNKEVGYWLEHRGPDQLMLVVAEGHLQWDAQNRRFDPYRSDVALPVLTEPFVFATEPYLVDVSQDAPWDVSAIEFRDKVTGLAAPISGKSKYQLASDDAFHQRRLRRLRWAVFAGLLVTVLALIIAVAALRDTRLSHPSSTVTATTTPGGTWPKDIGTVESVAFSPDGTRIVSGSADQTVRVWNAATGQQIGQPLTGHTGPVDSVAFSPNGGRIVSGSADATVRLWDAATGQQIGQPLTGHTGPVHSVAFSPDGTRIVSGSADQTVRVWNAATGQQIGQPLTGHTGPVFGVAFSPDGGRIVSGSADATVRLWDAATRQQIGQPLTGHTGPVFGVAFSPDGTRIVSGSADQTVRVWNAATGQPVGAPFIGHTGPVFGVAFSPDGGRIVSGSADKTVRVWNAATGLPVAAPFTGHTGAVHSVAFSPDGGRIVSGSEELRVWDADTGRPIG